MVPDNKHTGRINSDEMRPTKIGILPGSWKVASLGHLCDEAAPIRYGVVQIGEHTDGGIPIVPIKHIRRIDKVALHRAAQDIERKYKGSRVEGKDILLSVKGTIGEVGIVPDGFKGNIAREIARIRPGKKCDGRYLALQLDAPATQKRIDRVTVGSTRREFSIHAVRDFLLPLPPLPEQRKIADILSTWDAAIEKTEALLATAKAQKRALMQSLLTGKRRFPEFEGQEWKTEKLIDHFDFINGKAFKPDDWGLEGLPIIRIQNLTGSTDSINYFDGHVAEKHMVRDGDFLLSWSATLDTFIWHGGDAVLNQHIFKVVPNSDTLKMFGFHLITYEIGKLVSKVHGTSMKHITKKDLSKITSFFPAIPEQLRITRVLDDAQAEAARIEADLAKLRTEKKALMQQLLTGKRRVVV